jgi:hypothetical protein
VGGEAFMNRTLMQGDGGGGTLRIAHGAEGEASIGFYRYSDLRSAQAGDGWVLGVDSYGAGAGNLGLGTPERNLVWVIRKDGSAGLGPISATSVATPSFTGGTGSFRSVLAQEGTFLTARVTGLLSSDTASSSRVIANRITATGPFGGVEAQQGAIQTLVAGSLTLGSMSAGPSGATFRAPVTFTGPVTANYIGSEQIAADALLSNSLSVVGALDVGANGSIVRTPLGIQGSTTLTGSFRCYGTGTIDNLSAANATLFGVTLNGPLQVGTLGSLPTPVKYTILDWAPGLRYYRLGIWTAPQNGRVLKLTVVSCTSGYNFDSGGNTTRNPVVAETVILFHSSNNVDSVPVVGNTDFATNACYGWGWAYSIHALIQIPGVYVAPDPNDRSKFEFWVALNGYSGHPLVEASTSGVCGRRA